ncbi:hypothetical protein CTI12_AA390470 [Artemisia annua]|uniref:Uncharacterized protein n=1 Tax=Artemisia annua TaxID=35608 RepID=A0A2U1MEA1_ARTAN|nr:hypothetical protein CTI12_AA390470 [Artemisia annua]
MSQMQNHLKAFFQWEVVADLLVCEVWEDSMRKLYPNLMSKARDVSIKMAQLDGFILKPYNPEWIKSCYGEDMIDRVWNMKSKLSKRCVGSIAVSLLRRRLENELHISRTPVEIFELTHTKKGVRNRGYGR